MKKRALILLVLSIVVFGGGAWMAQKTNLFLSPRAKQLAYLKEHEDDMADFVKALSSKVESVQFNWDSIKVGQVGNGTPQGGGYMMTVNGSINNNKNTEFTLGIPLKRNLNEVPEELVIYEMQPIRILRDGGWFLYE
ncbi:hypothetical protein B7717_01685 [Streptococcus oralis subsp. oralis]|jgi:hypothetical protein|uniref:Uncharacterized protein n=1 Tax=Streptococcus oralis subsp. oralis TaxID=1891914 RepID=A0A1X1HPF6_STROR|nr:hypothetical protein [Streptococcus oralis]ORO62559.1 hypothetical protein B7718_02270 [Streptococcus oralis subsp. oralis]ORO62691.1 hypothetical protein B7717_01685 [Streptococcus oralis subsp. oralis]